MSKRRQGKSGSSKKKHVVRRVVRRLRGKNGAGRTIYSDGSQTIKMSPEMVELMKNQLKRFKEKFGREPGPGDPIFFDEDADEPKYVSQEKFGRRWNEVVNHALRAGIPPEKAFAMWVTERIITTENASMLTEDEHQEWEDAVDEYIELSSERSRLFRVVTVEGANVTDHEGVERMMELARELGVYDRVMKQIREQTEN